ncbi:TPA: hypothetical protein ACH3X1_004501 [Trebouxia sp. C0004]
MDKENEPSASNQEVDQVSPDELKLNVTAGPSAGTDFCKPGVLRLTVGRTRASKVWIKDTAVSEKHAEIYWDDQAWVLQDKGSSNGTLLNGVSLVAGGVPSKLKHGDMMQFGTDSQVKIELTPVLSESVTVQQYLEAETLRQVHSIKASVQISHGLVRRVKTS